MEVGEVVRLKSGGPKMTVFDMVKTKMTVFDMVKTKVFRMPNRKTTFLVHCAYFDEGKVLEVYFPKQSLFVVKE